MPPIKVSREGIIMVGFHLKIAVHPTIIRGNITAPHTMKNIRSFFVIRPAPHHIQQTNYVDRIISAHAVRSYFPAMMPTDWRIS